DSTATATATATATTLPAAAAIAAHEPLLRWLLARAARTESTVSQNKQYAAEVLAIVAQSSANARRKLAALDAADILLQLAAPYRRRDPDGGGGDEEEYVANVFETLTCLADEPVGKAKLVEA